MKDAQTASDVVPPFIVRQVSTGHPRASKELHLLAVQNPGAEGKCSWRGVCPQLRTWNYRNPHR